MLDSGHSSAQSHLVVPDVNATSAPVEDITDGAHMTNPSSIEVEFHNEYTCTNSQDSESLHSEPGNAVDDADSGVSSNDIEEVFNEETNATVMAEHIVPKRRTEGIKRTRLKSQWLKNGFPGWLQRMEEKRSKHNQKQALNVEPAAPLSPKIDRFFIPTL